MRRQQASTGIARPQPLLTVPHGDSDYTLEKWLAIAIALLFLLPLIATAQETSLSGEVLVSIDEVSGGTLLLRTTHPDRFVPAPALETRIELDVRGIVARGRVSQTFINESGFCVEAIYALPLPDGAAVDQMYLTVGGRRIEGVIREKEEARLTYEAARSEGRKTSLLEQHRPDIFTISVASVAPGETVEVEIGYQQTVEYDAGRFTLRIPGTVAPRYLPRAKVEESGAVPAAAEGSGSPALQYRLPGERGNSLSVEVELDAGLPLQSIESPTHAIDTMALSGTLWKVKLGPGAVAADRDFILSWVPRAGSEPRAATFTERHGDHTYSLIMIVPPSMAASAAFLPREAIFILDTSGSMLGESLDQAKRALLLALDRLRPSDSFNVIEFNSYTSSLFESSRVADREALSAARAFVSRLEAAGGTEMRPALELALSQPELAVPAVRQIVFITDGQVGNERELFEVIDENLGDARLFTVGIGSAPNGYFMRHAARRGRGTATFISGTEGVEESMRLLFAKLEGPVLSDVVLDIGREAEVWPARIPDLYAGEPLVAAVRLPVGERIARVRARSGSGGWSEEIVLTPEDGGGALAKLWARRKIEALTDSRTEGVDPELIREKALAVALTHHLVSSYTSLVAVDATPAGVDPESCVSVPIPMDLPDGWGGIEQLAILPATGTSGKLFLLIAVALTLAAVIVRRHC